jgi:hypothetical protein
VTHDEDLALFQFLEQKIEELSAKAGKLASDIGDPEVARIAFDLGALGNDELSVYRYLGRVKDKFGSFWCEDAYQSWLTLRSEEQPQSLQYRTARHHIENLRRLAQLPPFIFAFQQVEASGRCSVEGCLIPAVTAMSAGQHTEKLCGAHAARVFN